jgi:hypothetical protein
METVDGKPLHRLPPEPDEEEDDLRCFQWFRFGIILFEDIVECKNSETRCSGENLYVE